MGYSSRFVAALFSLSLIWRGRIPGDTAAAAALTYQRMQSEKETYTYYGRVVHQVGWVVLQYWFFSAFDNWRSGFHGVNDHEGDWEMVCVYCSEEPQKSASPGESGSSPVDRMTPRWVAYAAHDFYGDDLRRRWDDPELDKIADHPVVFAAAGSHASYFSAGEYMTVIELPFLAPLVKLVDRIQEVWVNVLRQAGAKASKSEFNVFRVPFVDYARGDGLAIGPGQAKTWQACILDDNTPWAMHYRGLWGLFTQDPITGENAPAGPVYNRDGTVRQSWFDPIGWAGLDKVPPPEQAVAHLQDQHEAILQHDTELKKKIAAKSEELERMGEELAAMQGQSHLASLYTEQARQVHILSKELSELRRQITVNHARLDAIDQYQTGLQQGHVGSLRAHIHRANTPLPEAELRFGALEEGLAAISVGLMMIAIVLLIIFARHYLLFGLAGLISVLVFLEASFRHRLPQLINSLTIGMAIVSALVLLFEFFWQIVVAGVLLGGLFIMWENLRELRR